jgi:hypothetical protein
MACDGGVQVCGKQATKQTTGQWTQRRFIIKFKITKPRNIITGPANIRSTRYNYGLSMNEGVIRRENVERNEYSRFNDGAICASSTRCEPHPKKAPSDCVIDGWVVRASTLKREKNVISVRRSESIVAALTRCGDGQLYLPAREFRRKKKRSRYPKGSI